MSTTPLSRPAERPALSETVNVRTGAIRVAGHLTAQGADLLRGTVESLRRSGHTRVYLDLADVRGADEAGLDVLRDVDRAVSRDGGVLLLRHAPQWLTAG